MPYTKRSKCGCLDVTRPSYSENEELTHLQSSETRCQKETALLGPNTCEPNIPDKIQSSIAVSHPGRAECSLFPFKHVDVRPVLTSEKLLYDMLVDEFVNLKDRHVCVRADDILNVLLRNS